VAIGISAAVLLALVVGGILTTGSQSNGYWLDLDRSFAAGMRPLVQESARIGSALHQGVPDMPGETRRSLQAELDTFVRSADQVASDAATLATPSPQAGVGAAVAGALADRARALTDLRLAVDRLLQMTPLPVAGATGERSAAVGPAPRPLSVAGATKALHQVGVILSGADRRYAAARRTLLFAPGGAILPRSAWEQGPGLWTPAPVAELVGALDGSPTLAAAPDVALLVTTLSLTPAPVPAAPGAAPGSAVVPPTDVLGLSVVVADEGNTTARHLRVRASITPQGGGVSHAGTARVSLTPGGSVSVDLGPLAVRPGTTYEVSLALEPPAGESAGAVTSDAFVLAVAPNAPAPK
jgi:hypothetical protein